MKKLIEKYSLPVPRYTSYPTVPHWNEAAFEQEAYIQRLVQAYGKIAEQGLSLYIHLPYCESLCTYCACNTRITVNHAVEGPYIDALIKEWDMYSEILTANQAEASKIPIREIHLGGGTPTFFAPQQLERLIKGLMRRGYPGEGASFSFEAHPANTSPEHLKTLRKCGFDRLSLGVQDFDPVVQKAIHRWQSPEDVQRVCDTARSEGYRSINFDLVYGLPFQSSTSFAETLAQVCSMRPDRIALYGYAHVPWKHPGQRAYSESDLPGAAERLNLFEMARIALLNAGYEQIGLDHFALPQDSLYQAYRNESIHRNFMGYNDVRSEMLLALGVSAISETGSAYAQNVKTVEAYLDRIKQGKLPIAKGHLLSEQEKYIAGKILSLMCLHRSSWKDDNEAEKAYMESCRKRLTPLELDGLIELDAEGIRVKEAGKILVRNICAAIDKDLLEASDQKRFATAI